MMILYCISVYSMSLICHVRMLDVAKAFDNVVMLMKSPW